MFISNTTGRNRHQLLRSATLLKQGAPEIAAFALATTAPPINTVEELRAHLCTAIEIEHATIPPYLCALYSLPDGDNAVPAQIIRSVVIEEMLHMILAANILNAIGGTPQLNQPNFIPNYPTRLPHSGRRFVVNLLKFSPEAIQTFLKIERPARPDAPPQSEDWRSIAQFYDAIKIALQTFGNEIFTGDPARQITAEYYYGSGGRAFAVSDVDSAIAAINEIIGQGEGVDGTIFAEDGILAKEFIFKDTTEYAHYFRFNQIMQERYYTDTDTPESGPTGPPLAVNWNAVYNMRPNPKMADYPTNSPLWQKSYDFNVTYQRLLNRIERALLGQPDVLMNAVMKMYDLKYQAIELMNIPVDDSGQTAGPSFEYVAL
jgi:Ferritin-like